MAVMANVVKVEDRSSESSGVYADPRGPEERGRDLLARLLAHDEEATEQFYFAHVEQVRRVCFRLLGPFRDSRDTVQDVFLEALTHLHTLRDPDALRAWLIGVAVRTCRRRLQSESRRFWLKFLAPEHLPETSHQVNHDHSRELVKVYDVFERIGPKLYFALVLRRVEGLSLAEAANASGVSLATFKRRLKKAEEAFFSMARTEPELSEWLRNG